MLALSAILGVMAEPSFESKSSIEPAEKSKTRLSEYVKRALAIRAIEDVEMNDSIVLSYD